LLKALPGLFSGGGDGSFLYITAASGTFFFGCLGGKSCMLESRVPPMAWKGAFSLKLRTFCQQIICEICFIGLPHTQLSLGTSTAEPGKHLVIFFGDFAKNGPARLAAAGNSN
jgi:hypothetical protein